MTANQTHLKADLAQKVEAAAATLRDLLREAHGTVKDLRQVIAEARQLAGRLADDAAREIASRVAEASAAYREQPVPELPDAELRCPDCAAAARLGSMLNHDDHCPLGLAVDALTGPGGCDAQWFREHPDAEEFCRPITATEKAEIRAYGPLAPEWARGHSGPVPDWIDVAYTKVLVTRVDNEDGEMIARTRKFLT
jgi:hypothetical protein